MKLGEMSSVGWPIGGDMFHQLAAAHSQQQAFIKTGQKKNLQLLRKQRRNQYTANSALDELFGGDRVKARGPSQGDWMTTSSSEEPGASKAANACPVMLPLLPSESSRARVP